MGYIYGGIAAIILALSVTTFIFYQRSEIAVLEKEKVEKELSIAVGVNQQNARAMRELQIDRQIERALTQKELEAAEKRATSIEQTKKDMQNVPGANDPVVPYFDTLGDELRKSDSRTAD